MYPKSHIMLGIIFVVILYCLFPRIGILNLWIIFLSSVLIDVDHYIVYVKRKRKLGLMGAFLWYDKRIKNKKECGFHFLHTVEIHVFIFILAFFWHILFLVFIGIMFHSITDFIEIGPKGREYFLIRWLIKKYF